MLQTNLLNWKLYGDVDAKSEKNILFSAQKQQSNRLNLSFQSTSHNKLGKCAHVFCSIFFFCFDHLQHLMERIKSRLRSDVIQHNLLFRSFFFLFGVTPNGWTVQAHERINFFYELVAKMLSHRNISIMPIATSSEVNYPFRQTLRSVKLNSNYAGTAFSLYSFCR